MASCGRNGDPVFVALRKRNPDEQSDHDEVIDALANIYVDLGHEVHVNPDSEKNASVEGRWPDVIVVLQGEEEEEDEEDEDGEEDDAAVARFVFSETDYVFEVETSSSTNITQAKGQWLPYDDAFEDWYVVVPDESADKAGALIDELGLENATVVTWWRGPFGRILFDGLP